MNRNILWTIAALVVIIIGAGSWWLMSRSSTKAGDAVAEQQVQQQAQQQELQQQIQNTPAPILANIVAIEANTLTIKAQSSTTTETLILTPTTGIFDSGAPVSWKKLTKGELVAVVLYPPSVGQSNVVQSITVVTGQ